MCCQGMQEVLCEQKRRLQRACERKRRQDETYVLHAMRAVGVSVLMCWRCSFLAVVEQKAVEPLRAKKPVLKREFKESNFVCKCYAGVHSGLRFRC